MPKIEDIAAEYLRSFPVKEKTFIMQERELNQKRKYTKEQAHKIKKGTLNIQDILTPSKRELAKTCFTHILNKSPKFHQSLQKNKEDVLDPAAWQDLNLIAGNVANPEQNTLANIKQTRTIMGGCVMATQMVNPSTDRANIESKQIVTRFLIDNRDIASRLYKQVNRIAKKEKIGLTLWQSDNPLTHKTYQKQLKSFYYKLPKLRNLNKSIWGLQIRKFWKDIWLNIFIGSMLLLILYHLFDPALDPPKSQTIIDLARNYPNKKMGKIARILYEDAKIPLRQYIASWLHCDLILPFSRFFFATEKLTYSPDLLEQVASIDKIILQYVLSVFELIHRTIVFSSKSSYELIKQDLGYSIPIEIVFSFSCLMLIPSLCGIYGWYTAYYKFKRNRSTLNFLAAHLIPLQDLIHAAQEISRIVGKYPTLEKRYGQHLTKTRQLLNPRSNHPSAVKQLIANLQCVTLHQHSYFFSNTGRMLAAYQLFQEHKASLADIYYEIGLMDSQLAICRLMVESRNSTNHFVFAQLEASTNNLPYMAISNLWHPGLNPQKAISNDVRLDSEQGPRTICITGPNGGGKTTFIKAVSICAIMVQAFGIGPAQDIKLRVFYKIITYVNPTQNLAAGLSLGEAGMEVLNNHKQILERVQQPTLAIVDEILNGVDPKVATKNSYIILKKRHQKYPYCVTLITTHFFILTKLVDDVTKFVNKKVMVTIPGTDSRKFDYTFKIEEGIADQNIVEDMLHEKGVL